MLMSNMNHPMVKEPMPNTVLRVILYAIIILISVIALVIGLFYLKYEAGISNVQADMQEYLRNKYNRWFVVERPRHSGGGFAVEGYMEAIAYPKDDSTLKFEVRKSSSDIWDGYADRVWAEEETKRVRQRLDEVMLGADYEYHVNIGSYLVRADIKYPLPSLDSF